MLVQRIFAAENGAFAQIASAVGRNEFMWRGAVERSKEFMLVIKSSRELLPDLQAELSRMHSYEIPEVLAIPIVDGAEDYLNWMGRELQPAGARE